MRSKTLVLLLLCVLCFGEKFNRVTPIVEAYKAAENAIVNISGYTVVAERIGGLSDMFDFFGPSVSPRRYKQQRQDLGSGFVVHQDGYVVTNAHVVDGLDEVITTFTDGREFKAKVISADANKDIAFLKIESEEQFSSIIFGKSCDLMIGETVIAVGNPFGFSSSVTDGIVSAKGRNIKVRQDAWLRGLIQTSAPINPGNSGGPLLNINGELIGVNTAIRAEAQNIGFAIPVDMVADGLADMLLPEKMRRVNMGLLIGRMECGNNDTHGLKVETVFEDSPAAKMGVSQGDLITEIDGEQVHGFIDFYVKMMSKEIGEDIRLTCLRKDTTATYNVALELQPRPIPDGRAIASRFFQFEVSELTSDIAKDFGFESEYPVMIITDITPNGVAEQTGLRKGDVILQVSGAPVSNMKDFSLEMEKVKAGQTTELHILRIGWYGNRQVDRQYLVKIVATPAANVKNKLTL